MTLDYFLYKLMKAGEKMRELQKGYYFNTDLHTANIDKHFAEIYFDEILEKVKEFLKDKLKQDA